MEQASDPQHRQDAHGVIVAVSLRSGQKIKRVGGSSVLHHMCVS